MSLTLLIYALLAGLLPSMIWLSFWLREDKDQPEPRQLLSASFFGGILAVIVTVFVERYIAQMVDTTTTRYILWAFFEEIIKFTAVAIIALGSKAYDEPIDAMVYCITVALGFAALENALFVLSPILNGQIATSIVTENMRFIGATLVHVVCTASVGFALGVVYYRGWLAKSIAIIVGLGVAGSLHTLFNLSIISAGAVDVLETFGWVWVAVVILIILFEEIKVVRPKTNNLKTVQKILVN